MAVEKAERDRAELHRAAAFGAARWQRAGSPGRDEAKSPSLSSFGPAVRPGSPPSRSFAASPPNSIARARRSRRLPSAARSAPRLRSARSPAARRR